MDGFNDRTNYNDEEEEEYQKRVRQLGVEDDEDNQPYDEAEEEKRF